MVDPLAGRDVVVGMSPFARVVAAVCRAGGLGVLDLGGRGVRVRAELDLVRQWAPAWFGVRVPDECLLSPGDLPDQVDTVVLGRDSPWRVADLAGDYRVLVEVASRDEAARAARDGAHGLVARGGRAGGLSSFVLLQQLVADGRLPVWLGGDAGSRTAAAAVVGGAAGVVLDDDTASVGHAVRDIRTAVLAGLDEGPARTAAAVLRPGSALCEAIGSELPIAQGPMTRVSDQAAFAAAVAGHGALPFVALALANEAQTRTLLEQTRRAIPDRPWGVGVLGFAPEDVRAAQLEVIRELRPPCVIVAGGRPAQAAALEADGIQAFLHVPSPGLLRQFLDAGARRFVFEGAECGGHVGPQASFPLWEAQIGVLSDYLDEHPAVAADIQVFFAGGVHDARSSAMVAVAAEPLAARGVGVGVLMGSAYLFTEEAVTHGAVLDVADLIIRTMQTYDELTAAGERTAATPASVEIVQLLAVPIPWTTQADVQLRVDEIPRLTIRFQLDVILEVSAEAVVKGGRLTAVRSGHCTVTVTLNANEVPLTTNAATLDLAVCLPIGSGIPLARVHWPV